MDYYGDNDAYVTQVKPVDTAGVIGLVQKFSLVNNSEIVVPDDDIFDWASDESFSIEFWFKMFAGNIIIRKINTDIF